jgi:hypothetical protein
MIECSVKWEYSSNGFVKYDVIPIKIRILLTSVSNILFKELKKKVLH